MTYRAIDLFAGAGGLGLGLAQAGWKVEAAVEIEKDFAATYKLNHPDTRVLDQPIEKVSFTRSTAEIAFSPGSIDLVAGGPPCQGFSTVGKKDINDPRNSLWNQFLRIVDEVEPRFILFENVAGFRRMYGGSAHAAVAEAFHLRGYKTISRIVDPTIYGLPQYRPRMILIGYSGSTEPVWPAATHGSSDLFSAMSPLLTLLDAISDLPPIGPGKECREYALPPQNDYQRRLRGNCTELVGHNCANYGAKMQEILRLVPPGGSVNDLPEHLRPKSYFANTYARLVGDQPSPTITRNFGTPSSSRCIHPLQNRALSTREGARLQSFPDDYAFQGSKGSQNLQIGNAVPPLLGQIIGQMIRDCATPQRLVANSTVEEKSLHADRASA